MNKMKAAHEVIKIEQQIQGISKNVSNEIKEIEVISELAEVEEAPSCSASISVEKKEDQDSCITSKSLTLDS